MTQIQESTSAGLVKIPTTVSNISYIDGEIGLLEYRGYNIVELARKSRYEEVAFLLIYGYLPAAAELQEFTRQLTAYRELPDELIELLQHFPRDIHPAHALQAAVTMLPGYHALMASEEAIHRPETDAVRLISQMAVLVAALHRIRNGKALVPAHRELSHAQNFLYMLHGERPDPLAASAMETCMILYADQSINNSTFTGRIVASTNASPIMVVTAALSSLSGPLHGGAGERVMKMLDEIGEPENAKKYLDQTLATPGARIMGFGHRVFNTIDPRVQVLNGIIPRLFARLGTTKVLKIVEALEKTVLETLTDKNIHPNVELKSGIIYHRLGIENNFSIPIFAVARITGWMAHWLEERANHKLIRPAQIYQGNRTKSYIPADTR
jgi:citrate synthase